MQSIYLDNGATSFPKAPGVGEAMARYINEIGANINRGTYKRASAAAMAVLDTRTALAALFSFGGGEDHVVFTPGATAGLNLVLQGYLHEGDHVIVSSLEHNAVMRPLTALAAKGVSVSRIPADENGLTDPRDMLPLLRPNTRLVMVSHASNVCGALFPLEETAALCAERDIPLAVDAAQTAGHDPIDFDALHLAALCVPGHKGLLGPQGVGALLLERKFAQALEPIVTGGTGSASDSETQPKYMPDRFEAGTQNLPGIFGLQSALAFVQSRGVEALHAHEAALTARLLAGLQTLPLRIVGPQTAQRRVGVVSVDTSADNAVAAYRLETEYGVMTRCGLHCAPNAHRTLHTFPQGTIRFSLGYASTEADVDAAVAALRGIVEAR